MQYILFVVATEIVECQAEILANLIWFELMNCHNDGLRLLECQFTLFNLILLQLPHSFLIQVQTLLLNLKKHTKYFNQQNIGAYLFSEFI